MNPMQMVQAFLNFKNNFKGDPQAEVMRLISSGKISQEQLNQLQMMAKQLSSLLK